MKNIIKAWPPVAKKKKKAKKTKKEPTVQDYMKVKS